MDFKEKEEALLHEAKEEFAYVANPDNCGKIVSSHFNGIVIAGYVLIFAFLLSIVGGPYYYGHHVAHRQDAGSTPAQSRTQPQ